MYSKVIRKEEKDLVKHRKRLPLPLLLLTWCLFKFGQIAFFPFKLTAKFSYSLSLRLIKLSDQLFAKLKKKQTNKRKSNKQFVKFPKLSIPAGFYQIPRLIPIKVSVALTIFLALLFFYSVSLISLAKSLPSPSKLSDPDGPVTTQIFDRNGNLLYRVYENKNRSLVKLQDLPPYLVNATIAIEDKNFYAHSGVDFAGVTRAILAYIEHHQVQGGSTITQQLIKNTLLTPDRTIERKIKEIALAFWAERIYNKKEILQMYFNEVPYGGTAWGINAASQTYFGKEAKELTLAEASYLAGLPASPTTYSPYGSNAQLGKDRQREVLRRMVEDGYISQTRADQALAEVLDIKPLAQTIKAPHFVFYVRQVLAQKYGEKLVSSGGLKVYTTLDSEMQKMAEQVVADEVDKLALLNVTNGAAMITDPRTGQILAMVGSKNYWDTGIGNFNVADALRQPGSSIKPITYATAFKQGYSPGSTVIDAPIAFKNAWEVYAPVNYDGRFHGPVTIRTALGSSYNVPAVKTLNNIGISNMLQTAHDMGITSLNDNNRYGLSLTLGGGEVKLVDMMTVYGTLSQMGVKYDSQPILKIVDSNGNILEDNQKPEGKKALDPGVAYLITDILKDNNARTPAFGPNSLLNIPGHTVAVKTGTTDNKRDNWCFGYTPEIAVGAWVGNNNNDPMDPRLTSGITGASPIWNKIMTNLLKDKPNLAFTKPDNVTMGMVDGHRDLVLTNQAKPPVAQNNQPGQITYKDPFLNPPLQTLPSPTP